MKSITVTQHVRVPLEDLFESLQTPGSHGWYADHVLADDDVHVEMIAVDDRDWKITERATGADGDRLTTGELALFPLAADITEVTFTQRFDRLPRRQRAVAPLLRRLVARANRRALALLAAQHQQAALARAA